MSIKKVILGSDHAGFYLKQQVINYITSELKIEVEDVGPKTADRCDYPDFSVKVSAQLLENDPLTTLGIVICGSGIGISMGCNKMRGIRCGLSHDYLTAKYSRENLNCNVLSMGERIIGVGVAEQMVKVFLTSEYKPTQQSEAFNAALAEVEQKNLIY